MERRFMIDLEEAMESIESKQITESGWIPRTKNVLNELTKLAPWDAMMELLTTHGLEEQTLQGMLRDAAHLKRIHLKETRSPWGTGCTPAAIVYPSRRTATPDDTKPGDRENQV